ncbi:diacylglycerol/lipid kinase family protein [Cumulibacter manganitolerans]|uniref:diacylglycerol/lipid kinase family protein n=1 Tax=Cumulibacter manganitolerans TaxID=1884992 RepID=UPI0018862E53|nr:diacylglycerol kinase family protein [Cumulibacter manganitolerans]
MPVGSLARLPLLRRRSARYPLAGAVRRPDGRVHRVGAVVHALKDAAPAVEGVLAAAVARAGWPPPRYYRTTATSFGREQAAQALADGCDLVVACGGDGTVRMTAHTLRHTGVPLGIVPIGTANLLARNLLLPLHRPEAAVEIALQGGTAPIDLGSATLTVDDATAEHLFLVLAGIGNDAVTVHDTHGHLKGRLGWLAYAEAGLRHALDRPVAMRVTYAANPPRELRAWSLLTGSFGKVPGGIEIFPGAVADDGVLDVLEVTVTHPVEWLPIGVKGLLHLRSGVRGLRHTLSPGVLVEPVRPLPVQLDGDVFCGVTRLDVQVDHRALQVRVPLPLR